jgi:hypothetical protein
MSFQTPGKEKNPWRASLASFHYPGQMRRLRPAMLDRTGDPETGRGD